MKKSVEKKRNKIRYGSAVWRLWMWIRRRPLWIRSTVQRLWQWLWQWRTLNNILISILLVGLGGMLVLVVYTSSVWWHNSNLEDNHENLRNLIYASGGVGVIIGLLIATQRQKTFSDQVQVQIDQSFNEKLGRGVELLAKEDTSTRSAGIHVLKDLFNNANEEQKPIIANIIYDFFHEKTRIRRGKNGKPLSSKLAKESRQDVQAALDYLTGLPLDERDKLLQSRLINSGRFGGRFDDDGQIVNGILDFSNLDFGYLEFKSKIIERISFNKSYFNNTAFGMRYTDASKHTIASGRIPNSTIRSCFFAFAQIKNTVFYEMVIEHSFFYENDIDFESVTFHRVVFLEKTFLLKNDNKIPSVPLDTLIPFTPVRRILPLFMFMDIGEKNFNFVDDFEPKVFFRSCYYPKNQRLSSKMDASREYEERGHGDKFFVIPEEDSEKKSWSGQPVDKWVAVEVAEWRLMRVEAMSEDTTELESELVNAKKELQDAKERLNKYQKNQGLSEKMPDPPPFDFI